MKNMIAKFAKDESGATAIEYGLIAALVAVVSIAALTTVGTQVRESFNKVGSAITNANQ